MNIFAALKIAIKLQVQKCAGTMKHMFLAHQAVFICNGINFMPNCLSDLNAPP